MSPTSLAQQTIASLAADPLYQLSTAGQELFHTNMLYWLATQRPLASRPIWDLLGVDPPSSEGPDARGLIRREWRHIDLAIDSGMPGRKLILENKVLAIATAHQLSAYHSAVSKIPPYTADTTSWRLLTLLPTLFTPPEPWGVVTYEDLLPTLRETAANLSGNDAALMESYASLVRRLIDLTAAFDPASRLDEPMLIETGLVGQLQDSRALSLVRKMQMSRCAEMLAERLTAILPVGLIDIEAGLTNTQGLMSLFLPGPHDRKFGWQIQGNQLRIVVIIGPRDRKVRAERERMVETEHLDFYEGAVPPFGLASTIGPYAGRKPWLGYEPDFVYRYRPLAPETSWSQLLDLLVWASTYAYEYATRADVAE